MCFLSLQRLGRLVREGRIVEALKLGLSIYEGTAPAVIGTCCETHYPLVLEQVSIMIGNKEFVGAGS